MRIFVTAPDETGIMRKTRLTLVDCNTTNDLLKRLSTLCNIHHKWIIAKIKQDVVNIRIIQGWSLDLYPLKQGSQIIVQNIPQAIKSGTEITSPPRLEKIDEQLQLELEDSNSTNGMADQKLSFNSDSNDHDWTKYFQQSLQQFLDAVRKNQIQKAANILKQQPGECTNEKTLSKIMPKKVSFLLNQLGECGRSALHWAVQENNLDMVQFLLIKSCNPNIVSIDHYTPLQLSIVLKASSIFQTLVSHPKIQLNKVTKKGTALHLCFEYSLINFAQNLIDHGADPEVQNNEGVTSIDIYKKLDLKGLKLKNNQKNVQELPFILRGTVNRVSSIASRLKERLLVVNPFANQFVLFQDKKAQQNIDLDSIKQVNYIKNKGWTMNKEFYYFQIKYSGEQIIFCLVNNKIGVHWVQNLRKCVNFCKKKLHKQKYPQNLQLVMILDDKKNDIKVHRRKKAKSSQQASRFSKQFNNKRVSLFDLVPQQQQKQQITKQVKIEYTKKQSQNQSQIINQSNIYSIPGTIIQQQPGYNDYRQSTLVSSILRTSIFSKYINKQETSQIMMQEKNRPIVCFKDFQVLRLLGVGSFGKVFLARHRREQKLYALKVLNKKKLIAKKQIKYAVGQANILKKVDSPFIIKLYYSFQTPTNLYMAIDYCSNGDLSQKIIQNEECLSENVCRFFIAQVVLAIQYLHKNNVIYRDLKPENILIGQDGYIRLADFNLSRQNHFSTSFCGSPAYLSPEMLQKKGVGPQADIYGIGCVLYEMMVGEPPFFDQNIDSLYDKIKNSRLKFPASISKPAKSLISSLLQRNTKKRIGVKDMKQIKNHQFFQGFQWKRLERLQMKVPLQLEFKNSDNLGLVVIQEHSLQDSDYENSSIMINRVKNFTFARQSEYQEKAQLTYV